jgi:hypothetical protein
MTTLIHGLIYGAVTTGYLLLIMVTISPRIWGYADYPRAVKDKVPPQTRQEKVLGAIIGLPWILFVFGFPVYSTIALKAEMGGNLAFPRAFLNLIFLIAFTTFGDLVVLDWLIISKITPGFVLIPGSAKEDYRDFSHHYQGHAKAAGLMIVLALILAAWASAL